MELICYGRREEKILLEFYPCVNVGENISWEEWHSKEPLVIFKADYEKFLIDYFNDIFPLTDPVDGQIQEYFDVCFENWIGKDDWKKLINNIKKDAAVFTDQQMIEFYQKFINWCEEQLEWADFIVVEGNQ